VSIDKFYDRVRKNEYRRRMPESALAGKGKHIMRCEKLLKNMFIVRDPPTPAWSTAKRPRVSTDEDYRNAKGGFFRSASSESIDNTYAAGSTADFLRYTLFFR